MNVPLKSDSCEAKDKELDQSSIDVLRCTFSYCINIWKLAFFLKRDLVDASGCHSKDLIDSP